jgi:hypothetical protein
MPIRAEFQSSYLLRYALLGGAFLFMSLYFAYDGFIGYPGKLPMAEAYDEIRELEPAKRVEEWEKIAKERGWPDDVPKKSVEEIRSDIIGQYVYGVITFLIALPAVLYLIRSRGSWVEGTDEGLTTSWGQSLRFADVIQLNKKRWADKGVAKATYKQGNSTKTFVFDDFKYERDKLGKILRTLESTLAREKIVAGLTEEEADAKRKQEQGEEEETGEQEA